MRNFVIGGAVLVAIALITPAYLENAPSNCGAVAMKVMSLDADATKGMSSPLARGIVNSFAGPILEQVITAAYPNVPAPATCAYMYWNVTFNPSAQADMRRLMKS